MLPQDLPCIVVIGEESTTLERMCALLWKGYSVDVKSYIVDVKGCSVDVTGYSVDVKGYTEEVKCYSVDVTA